MSWFSETILVLCIAGALFGPLVSSWVEKRLEWFMFFLGVVAASASGSWNESVIIEAITRPMKVCGAMLLGALVVSYSHKGVRQAVEMMAKRASPKLVVGTVIFLVGISAAWITSVIAVILLVELLRILKLSRNAEIHTAILGCFSAGIGGGLSPIGSPASAIVMANLRQSPNDISASYLYSLIGVWAVPAIFSTAVIAGILYSESETEQREMPPEDPMTLWKVMVGALRMYLFIAGLVVLGSGIVPLLNHILAGAPPWALYWVNSVSALIDGATLVSLEVNPNMTEAQLRFTFMSVLVASGALVPGAASNFLAAYRLGITNRQWAQIGVPFAAVLLVFCFIWMNLLRI